MIHITVCDDDPEMIRTCREFAGRFDSAHPYRLSWHFLEKPEEMEAQALAQEDILILDIQMGRLDGLETARIMRKINRESILIFVTNMAQFAIKGYEVDALDFIIKPVSMASIVYVMDKALKRLTGSNHAAFSLKTPEGTISLAANDITFVEVFDHNLVYHTTRGDYTVRGRLSDVSEKLDPERFVLCNRSFIVNLRHVSNVTADYLLIGDSRIPVSKSHRKELMKRFSSFLGDSL